ncbi:MAG: sodium:solute symporter [Bacteroidetes bacterium GWC2_33_15]|nr:MAG: sodium:solute symporter [Bacteroidetes bacterium GWA2_33_15]OFX50934.1 MAG: sodium:solute symporter [Bacteroidetes bacterium GWC2_33_15]OFX66561.1 MAG: sodium:solute symporter [Bacteroidetes bacterium GWB2_32_14]OFX70160.1 MAG: sodium:solute symporter [Bacteroidetes bacterium GWD2_33_33]HAN20029.1 sodium:solute symporter [Bacteroidales bacterium]
MNPYLILTILIIYFGILLIVAYFTSRNANNQSFFIGNRKSPWYIVSLGMIGASLSGVTFISVPGWVVDSNFSYMQMVLGYLAGYFVIATVLMPMYYRLNLTSIYTYLDKRFGVYSYKTGASFFLLSRLIGSALRLFIVANVLQITVFNPLHIPFEISVFVTILLIWLYTFKGGIKTIIWTDTLQALFMLTAVGATIVIIGKELNLNFSGLVNTVVDNEHSRIFFFNDFRGANFFFKQFFAGAFIAIVMTGLDQDMMQKNLSCKNIKDAQKNMFWFSIILVPVNLMFMSLGVLLFVFAQKNGIAIPVRTDDLYPLIATQGYISPVVGIVFIIGLVAAAYSSADSALTALTTSFTVDILNAGNSEEKRLRRTRKIVHLGVSLAMILVIILFNAINNESVISATFKVAGYTYGPLLGLYSFGLFTKYKVKDRFVPLVAIISPVLCLILNKYSAEWLSGYKFGFELLIVNGLFTFTGLFLLREKVGFKENI